LGSKEENKDSVDNSGECVEYGLSVTKFFGNKTSDEQSDE
jgi:hypothetical protein